LSYEFKCLICRDQGRVEGCPSCGKVRDALAISAKVEVSRQERNEMYVPKYYITNEWDESILRMDKENYVDDVSFNTYCTQLSKCIEILDTGAMLKTSAFVNAPVGYAKTTFAYNCILKCLENGYKMSPIIDTAKMRGMLTLDSERPTKPNSYQGFALEEYLDSDLLFLLVTRGPEYVYAYDTIIQVLDIRSRRGKPTIILSDRAARYLKVFDKDNNLQKILEGGNKVDKLKYAIPISFEEYI